MEQYKVLIIDDEPEFISIIIDLLAKENQYSFKFYHAVSGKMGFEIAKKICPNIIITDWDMPSMSGVQLIYNLKKEEITKNIPVIMITGKMTSSNYLEEAFEAGAIDFVRKPIERRELAARIKSVINLFEFQNLELKLKNQELAAFATHSSQTNQFLSSIIENLKQLKLIKPTQKQQLISKIESIEHNIENHTDKNSWTKFLYHFQQLHPNFENNINEKFPELKPAELKLIFLLRLNLSTKEIAEITFLHPDSVKTSRFRLRKKLNLSPGDSLVSFLTQF